MGIKPKFNNSQINAYALREYAEVERKLIEILQFIGEGFIKEARSMTKDEGSFGDITGNLRSSIGYFIVRNGNVLIDTVYRSDKGTDRDTGVKIAKDFIDEIKESDGLFLYGIAGMEYAREVESKGYNVISMQSDMAIVELKQILDEAA